MAITKFVVPRMLFLNSKADNERQTTNNKQTHRASMDPIICTALYFIAFLIGFIVQPGVAQDTPKTLLWKVEGNDINPSYVFGTIHLLPESEFELKKKVENAFMEMNKLVLELDMDDPTLPGQMVQHVVMADGVTLDGLFSEEDYALLDRELKAIMGVGVQPFNTYKPFMLAAFLISSYIGEQPASYEMALLSMANNQGMEVEGLETVKEQIALFDSTSYEDQAADIVEMLHDREKIETLYRDLVDMYKAEDLDKMFGMMDEYFDDARQMDILLTERNKRWIPMMEAKAQKEPIFFAVGAGHLGGPNGVIELLKQAGYTVTPVH